MIKNQTVIVIWTMLFWWSIGGITFATAGEVKLAVSDARANSKCAAHIRGSNSEITVVSVTSDELQADIVEFLNRHGRTNGSSINAALANAGIVFCGSRESKKFARFILRQLDSSQRLPRDLIPMIRQYQRLKSMQQALKELRSNDSISSDYKDNLARLKVTTK